jgi:hypothetical protein
MFFIMGLSDAQKKLEFVQTMLCSRCQQFGRFEVFMTYTYFSLFFIPIFKWNKKFYAKTSCCNTVYSIDDSLGKRILKGENITLKEEDLHFEHRNAYSSLFQNSGYNNSLRQCPNCGYLAEGDFVFCPKCGKRL